MLLGLVFALLGIYILLALAFESYSQPLLIMAVIPFGMAGAIIGLMLLGYGISIIAIMGMLALCGVVINDSLILISYANELRTKGGCSNAGNYRSQWPPLPPHCFDDAYHVCRLSAAVI